MVRKPDLHGDFTVEDVETEDVIFQGEPLTDDRAAQIAAHALAVRSRNLTPGGKSLSRTNGRHSPVVQVRLPEDARDELAARAERAGKSVSKYTRELILDALAS